MQIIIPMSGFGERFRRAGYEVPKPLIEVDGKPIITHVLDMFPGEKEILLICNQEHLDNPDYHMREILANYCPHAVVAGIPPHKLGPVYAISQVAHLIKPSEPVLVSYCDYSCVWDWQHFKRYVRESRCAGAIPAYKGFHPHSLGNTHYAYLRENIGWATDIQEKQPFTDNRMEEYASSGAYYFSSGELLQQAIAMALSKGWTTNDEYYVSLIYQYLFKEKKSVAQKSVAIYPLQHFMQWGTPEDLAEYLQWSQIFRSYVTKPTPATTPAGALIIPMAGLGQRFQNEGYQITKPLIPVSGKPMVLQAAHDLPPALQHVFVLRSDMPEYATIATTLQQGYPEAIIHSIPAVTEGQACTALLGLDALEKKVGEIAGPVTFGACDNGMLYDHEKFRQLADNPQIDVIVWGARGHANAVRHPQMFGWIEANNTHITNISVKTPLASPSTDPVVVGTFTFRNAAIARQVIEHLIARNGRINGEFYLDSCINDAISLGFKCRLFEVGHFISWGTPIDLRCFEYWQSCFHQWPSHPYRLELDARIPPHAHAALNARYAPFYPTLPKPRP